MHQSGHQDRLIGIAAASRSEILAVSEFPDGKFQWRDTMLGMDVHGALEIVDKRAHLPGQSDTALLEKVIKKPEFSATSKTLSPAVGLDRGVMLRPVEALHELAYVTGSRYQADLYDYYLQWALLRYLGFFDHIAKRKRPRKLGLSQAGKRTRGNQRRVASEELGIGFGALLARRWFTMTTGSVPVRIIDVDVALDDGFTLAAGSRLPIKRRDRQRPDYIMIADNPTTPGSYYIRVLECKGTCIPGVAIGQMAKAVGQLEGLVIGGCIPSGLAVGTIAANNGMSYVAIDPEDEEETSYEADSNSIVGAAQFRLSEYDNNLLGPVLASASLRASWGMLGDFGGNRGALDRWAPDTMRRKLYRTRSERVSFDTEYGTAVGTGVIFGFDRWRLNVRCAIAHDVDAALTQGDPQAIVSAQASFADRFGRGKDFSHRFEDNNAEADLPSQEVDLETRDVVSATPDG